MMIHLHITQNLTKSISVQGKSQKKIPLAYTTTIQDDLAIFH
jgi:hypothetical protein